MTAPAIPSIAWWEAHRSRYNAGLIVAGILAFLAYVLVGSLLPADDVNFEITIFTIFFQGIAYLFMVAVANICYCLGPVSERWVRPSDPTSYRQICFRMGFWFSVLLPFSAPFLIVVSVLTGAGYGH